MKMTVKQLQEKLASLKLPVKGNKAELTARLKDATSVAKAKPEAKKDKPVSLLVREIRQASEAVVGAYGDKLAGVMEFTPFKAGNSFVLRLPRHKDAIKRLPHNADAKEALGILSWLGDAVNTITGDNKQTWVLHQTGSFGLYSSFTR